MWLHASALVRVVLAGRRFGGGRPGGGPVFFCRGTGSVGGGAVRRAAGPAGRVAVRFGGWPVWRGGDLGIQKLPDKCCKLGCKHAASRHLSAIAGALWPMENTTKLHKDQLLSYMCQSTDGKLFVGPLRVCKPTQRALLAIGWGRRSRTQRGAVDARFGNAHVDKGNNVHSFGQMYSHLWSVYTSHAETMPDEVIVLPEDNPLQPVAEEKKAQVQSYWAARGTHIIPNVDRRDGGGELDMEIQPSEDCPVRWLPPGHKKDTWWLYLASLKESGQTRPAGSYPTMCRVWRRCFRKVLKVSKYGKHAKCDLCYQLKARIQLAASYADKLDVSRRLTDHIEKQWRDRMVYWRMRADSAQSGSKWICIIIDGADQAKFRVLKAVETPKSLDGIERPKMKVMGALAHGWELSMNFVEEDMPHNCNLVIEVLMRALDRIQTEWRAAASGTAFPCNLWVQLDNAGGENKNVHVMKCFAYLVDAGVFRTAVASYMQVGHTHEDIDFLFSVMSTAIWKMGVWDSPYQMAERVKHAMAAHVARTMKDIPVQCGLLDAVRDWKTWVKPLDQVKEKAGFEGIMSIRWICFLRRQDIPAAALCQPVAADLADAGALPSDVMVLCKEYMSDAKLCQPPLLMARAGASAQMLPLGGPGLWEARADIATSKVESLCKLIERHMPLNIGCADYLRSWMGTPRMPAAPPDVLGSVTWTYGNPAPGHEFAQAFSEAMSGRRVAATPHVRILRRKRNVSGDVAWSVSLPHYVNLRCRQGVDVDQAIQEWNGGRLCHGITD